MMLDTSNKEKIINNHNVKKDKCNNKIQFSLLNNNKKIINNDFTEINKIIISNDINQLLLFLKSGKNPNIYNSSGETPLFIHVKLGNLEAVNALLNYGADCNIQNNDGNSPLHIAINSNNENLIGILLENKANPNLINKTNLQTPFHLAIINKVNQNILNKLKLNKVDWNIKDKFNKTPFDYAIDLRDNNYLLLLNNIFGRKGHKINNEYNSKEEMNEININRYKSLPFNIIGNYNDLKNKMKYNEENKENNNFYNIIRDTNANTISEINSARENNSLHQNIKDKQYSYDTKNRLKNISLSESNKINKDYYSINEKKKKENFYLEYKSQSDVKYETKDIIKKIFMDTIKKINNTKQNNKKLNLKNLDNEKSNKKQKINQYKNEDLKNNELTPSETNNLTSTFLDESDINSNIIIKNDIEDSIFIDQKYNNNNKSDNKLLLKESINNSPQNINLKRVSVNNIIKIPVNYNSNIENINNFDNNIKKNFKEIKNDKNIKCNDMKFMIIQQIKDKNINLELGSPLNLSNELLSKLKQWLISCDLLCYYNLLIEKKVYNIDEIISKMKNKTMDINYNYIEELGIKKPGHILRFLLKLQIDAEILDKKICDLIVEKYNSTTVFLNSSLNDIKCCGIPCFSHSYSPSDVTDNISNINNNDIFTFLKNIDLSEFIDNFIHNGFDQVDYIIIQLFSNFKFDKNMMNEYFHIYLENSQEKVIKKLYEEKEKIANEFNIPFNKNEIKDILSSFNDEYLMKKEDKNDCSIY